MGLDNPLHWAFIVVVLLLVFGARRLPEIGRSLGSGMREFKESVSGESKPTALGTGQQSQPPAAQPQQPVAQPQQPVTTPPPVPQPQQPVTTPAPQPQQPPTPEPVVAQPGVPSEQQPNPFGN